MHSSSSGTNEPPRSGGGLLRGRLRAAAPPSPDGPLRPFTPPDLNTIPHMDESSVQLGDRSHNYEDQPPTSAASEEAVPGPYIVGSPIDLGGIDNVDSINLRLGPLHKRSSRRKHRAPGEPQHIELRENDDLTPSPTTRLSPTGLYKKRFSLCAQLTISF